MNPHFPSTVRKKRNGCGKREHSVFWLEVLQGIFVFGRILNYNAKKGWLWLTGTVSKKGCKKCQLIIYWHFLLLHAILHLTWDKQEFPHFCKWRDELQDILIKRKRTLVLHAKICYAIISRKQRLIIWKKCIIMLIQYIFCIIIWSWWYNIEEKW